VKLKPTVLAVVCVILLQAVSAVRAQTVPPPASEQTLDIHTLLFLELPWDAGYTNRQDPIDVNSIEILFDSLDDPGNTGSDPLKGIPGVE